MRSMRFRTIAILGVAGVLPLAIGVPGASADHVDTSTGAEPVELFDVSLNPDGQEQTVKIPLTLSLAGQKILGPTEDYRIKNEVTVTVPQAAAGASVIGSISGHLEERQGPFATECTDSAGNPTDRKSVV